MSTDQADQVSARMAEIEAYDRAECLDRWKEMFDRPPPKYLSPQFMKRVLTWEAQNRALGDMSSKPPGAWNRSRQARQ